MTDTAASTGAEDVRWDLSDLYAEHEDPRLEADLSEPLGQAQDFAERYRGRLGELDAAALAEAVAALEAIQQRAQRAASYAHLRFAQDTSDPARGALLARVQERQAELSTALLFFQVEWNALDDAHVEELLADEAIAAYRHFLGNLRRYAPHQLSEPEERILAQLEPTGAAAWARLFQQLESAISVAFDGEEGGLEEALAVMQDPDRERRQRAQAAITEGLERDLSMRAFVFNTLLADKATQDRLRAHPHWLHSRNLENEADDAQVEALIEAVTSRYDIVARYYRLKARVQGLDELYDWDRYAPIETGDEPAIAWDDARDLVLDAYADFSPRMSELAQTFFERSWIDAPAAPGKSTGAFCHPVTPDAHPYVLLNYTGRARDVMTLAHELGHGVHMRLSQGQTLLNAHTPLTTAETASIFGETVTLARLLRAEQDPRRRFGLVARRLEDAFAAIFRQVAMNRFEDAVHTARREEGELSTDAFGDHWMRTQQEMFGDSLTLTDGYRCWWSYVPHFIAVPGYVYAYAYGNLLSFALYRRYEESGNGFVDRYLDEFLAAGGSAPPEELAGRLGVDLTDPGFWDTGLDVLSSDLDQAEELADQAFG